MQPLGGTNANPRPLRLSDPDLIYALIQGAESKRISKRKTIAFMRKKGVGADKMVSAYLQYYHENGLLEITFNKRPLGFSVIMDCDNKNAFVSNIQNEELENEGLGLKIGSKFHEINGKRVDGLRHKDILKLINNQTIPFYIVFKEVSRSFCI